MKKNTSTPISGTIIKIRMTITTTAATTPPGDPDLPAGSNVRAVWRRGDEGK